MVKPDGKRGTARGRRQRVETQQAIIERRERRQVTFSKRKAGLMKKASDASVRCGAHVAVVTFSGLGKPFALRTAGADDPLLHPVFAADDDDVPAGSTVAALVRETGERAEEARAEKERMDNVGKAVAPARDGKAYWWETDPEVLGPAELPEFARALQRLRDNVSRRIEHQLSALAPPPHHQRGD